MIEILGRATSINVRKVLWVCTEISLPFRLEEWGLEHRPTNTPEFVALNPNAMVPVIKDGAYVLWESNTIIRYLSAEYGNGRLLPSANHERATVEQWMDWQATELNNAWRYAFMALVRGHSDYTDPRTTAASVLNWNRHMSILNRQLECTNAFAVGNRFTLADVVLGLSVNRWYLTPMERPALAALDTYYERLSERPGFRAHGRNGVP